MEDSHTNLPKKYRKSLKSTMFTRFLSSAFPLFWFLRKPFKFIGQNAFPAHAISPQITFTGDRATPMKNCSKWKGRHASFLKSTQTTLQKPYKTFIKLSLFHHFAPAAETHIKPYENLGISSPPARAARRGILRSWTPSWQGYPILKGSYFFHVPRAETC